MTKCCEYDYNSDGNCHIHAEPGVLRVPLEAPSTFPMQVILGYNREEGRIAKTVYLAAYEVYSHVFAPQQAMIEGGCRGGFSTKEIIAFLYARSFPKQEWHRRMEEAFKGLRGIK